MAIPKYLYEAKDMTSILQMGADDLLALRVEDVGSRMLTVEEIKHIATTLDAFWEYDYKAAEEGQVGMHAELKSLLHSDKFLVSKILLEPKNIMRIISRQMAMKLLQSIGANLPDYVAGIPNGATELGENVGDWICVPTAKMKKIDGKIIFSTEIPDGATLLLVEDFSTRGTAFKEAVLEVKEKNRLAKIAPYYPVIVNRGGLEVVSIAGMGDFRILPLVELRVQDWPPEDCPLCKIGSVAIKPKASDESWRLITTSQLD